MDKKKEDFAEVCGGDVITSEAVENALKEKK